MVERISTVSVVQFYMFLSLTLFLNGHSFGSQQPMVIKSSFSCETMFIPVCDKPNVGQAIVMISSITTTSCGDNHYLVKYYN